MAIDRSLMLRMLATGALCLMHAASADACERRYPQANGDDRTRHIGLSARWPDAQILQNLKLNIDRADIKRSDSSSAVSVEYGYFQRTVVITRSASKGVEVKLLEAGRTPLVWTLGVC
jgi:hypothetical protein